MAGKHVVYMLARTLGDRLYLSRHILIERIGDDSEGSSGRHAKSTEDVC